MSCGSCGKSVNGAPRGCKSNGSCALNGCNKLTVYDWLAHMQPPQGETRFPYVEVRFKNSRKQYYLCTDDIQVSMGDVVVTTAEMGHDVGMVTLTGNLVQLQMQRKKVALAEGEEAPKILRKATAVDIERWKAAREREESVQVRARELALALKLQMKISDVEFQGDGKKATFYYTAESRVDFRQLIKDMAQAFSIRIEMRQIGLRQEASRLGGVGSCGRELCCSTWLTDFRSVSTAAARYQQLSLNPQKLAGQCGKLKCCLNFELDSYRAALKEFPRMETRLHTEKGSAMCQKIDIFKGLMWFSYKEEPMTWHKLEVEQVHEIIALNKAKKPVAALDEYSVDESETSENISFDSGEGADSLTRFDRPKKRRNNRNNRNRNRNRNRKPQSKQNG